MVFTFTNMSIPDSIKETEVINESLQGVHKQVHEFNKLAIQQDNERPENPINDQKSESDLTYQPEISKDEEFVEWVTDKKGSREKVVYAKDLGVYVIKKKPYVYINGKYLPYKTDNTYYVDGVKHFYQPSTQNIKQKINYVQNTRVVTYSYDENGKPIRDANNSVIKRNFNKGIAGSYVPNVDQKNSQSLNVAPEFGGAMNANNIQSLMKNLKKAQTGIEQRNQALETLMKE